MWCALIALECFGLAPSTHFFAVVGLGWLVERVSDHVVGTILSVSMGDFPMVHVTGMGTAFPVSPGYVFYVVVSGDPWTGFRSAQYRVCLGESRREVEGRTSRFGAQDFGLTASASLHFFGVLNRRRLLVYTRARLCAIRGLKIDYAHSVRVCDVFSSQTSTLVSPTSSAKGP